MKQLLLSVVLVAVSFASFAQRGQPASIVTQPVDWTGCQNTIATLTFTAGGNPPLTYQWYSTGAPGCEFCSTAISDGLLYSGTATRTLNINTSFLSAGTYYFYGTAQASRVGGVAYTNTVMVTVYAGPNAPTVTNGSSCGPGSVTLTAAGTRNGFYRWYDYSNNIIPGETNSTYTTPVLSATTNYYAAITDGRCESRRIVAQATIYTVPAAPTSLGGYSCGPGVVTLTASGGTEGAYQWYDTNNRPIRGETASTYTTVALIANATYYVSNHDANCESTHTPVLAEVRPVPGSVRSVTNGSGCGPSQVTLSATGTTDGNYQWYTLRVAPIAGAVNGTYVTPVISTTTGYYVAIVNNGCAGPRTLVTATINTPPNPPTVTGDSKCGPSASMVLTAAGGRGAGYYQWYTAANVAIPGEVNPTYTTPTLTTTTTYGVAIFDGTCYSTQTPVTATIVTPPGPPTATGATACVPSQLVLTASGGSAGLYQWYDPSGFALRGETNSTYTTPTISTTTTFFVAVTNRTGCYSSKTPVVATIASPPAAPTATGASACGPRASVTLTASGGAAGQYRWYTSSGTIIDLETNATYTTPVLSTTTNYSVAIDNGICLSALTPVTATILTLPTAPTATGGSGCGTSAVTLTAAGGTNGQYRWYTSAGVIISGQVNSVYVTPAISTTTNYLVSINNGSCESAQTTVTATILTPPNPPTATGASACGPSASVTLTAAGARAGGYKWYTSAGVLIAGETNATYTTPVISTTTPYLVSIFDGTCESTKTSVTATILTLPTAPGVINGAACGPRSTVLLTASGASNGQYRWYTSAGVAISGEVNSTYTTPSIAATTNFLVSINNGTCESTKTTVTATILTPPTPPTTTGGSSCGSGAVVLTAAGGTNGQYRWYTSAGVAISGQTNGTYTTPVISSTTSYLVSINNGTCESSQTSVTATINTPPAAPTATGASSCGPASLTLTASGSVPGQYRWYTSAGVAITGEVNATYTTPTLSTTTSYLVSINNGTCESTKTSVTATINTIPTAPTTTNNSACGPRAAVTLTAAGGVNGQYRWYTSAGVAITGEVNSTYTTPVLTTTTSYLVSINNGTCESTKTSVTASITGAPSAPTVTNGSSCGAGTVVLTAAGGTNGQYRWYTSAGVAIPGEVNSTYTTPVLSTTTNYLVSINNGCESPQTSVTATINTAPAAPTATGASSCGPASLTLTATGSVAGQYRWYTSAGVAITGEVNATYTTPTLSTTTSYLVSINNGTCESTKTSVTATINTIPTAPTTISNSACGPRAAVTLTAAGGVNGQYRWYTSAGVAITGEVNSTYTTPVLTTTTSYLVSINNGTCESTKTSVTASITGAPSAPTVTNGSSCGAGTVVLTATGGTNGQYRWYTSAGVAITGEVNSTYTTPVLSTTTNYLVSINNGCESPQTSVTATINTAPAAPTATGASSCGPASLTLTAAGSVAGQYRWYTSAGVAITGEVNATYTTPTLSATTSYLVSINNGTCESTKTSVTATINAIPTAPTTTNNSGCGPRSAVVLSAAGGVNGQYRWYTSAGVAITGEVNSTYTTPVLTTTTSYLVSINNGTCESTKTSVTASITGAPSAPTVTNGSSCGAGTVVLTAAGGTNGQYRWYTSAGVAITGEVNSTYTTPVLSNTTNYLVSINNGCESAQTSVTATINSVPAAPTATGASSCGTSAIVLTASGAANGQFRWYSSAGVAIAGEVNSTYVTPILTTTTSYLVSINNGSCEGVKTSVTATIFSVPTAPTTTSNSACGPTAAVTLTAAGGTNGQYRWYTSAGVAITGEVNSTYTTPVISATTSYLVSINNGSCESTKTSVTATITGQPAAPTVTGASACGPAAVTLTAAGGTNGQYRWYTSAGVAISGQVNSTYTTPVISTTTSYLVSVNNGCESTKTSVTATINTLPAAPGATGASSCGPGSLTLTASGGSAGQYRWYSAAGVAISGQTNSTYTTPVLSATTSYLVSISNGTCESTKTSVTATITTVPSAPGTTNNSACGPTAAITLTASGAINGQYRWYTSAGVAISGEVNSTYTTPVISSTTSYLVSINNGCEGPKASIVAVIGGAPNAPTVTNGAACTASAITLTAAGAINGQYRWYTSGGVLISGEVNSTYTTPVLSVTTTYLVSINNGCESAQTTVTASIGSAPNVPGVTGNSSCGPSSVVLTASGASAGQYRWYTASGVLIAGETNATYTTPIITSTTTYQVSIDNGGCESAKVSVTATITTLPTAPTVTGASACGPNANITLTASGGGGGQYRWYTEAGDPIAGQTSSIYTTPAISTTTNYLVAINNGTCESVRTTVTATIVPPPTAPTIPGSSGCGASAVTFTASGGVNGQYRWYTQSAGGTPIAGATNNVFTTPVISVNTTYYASIDNGSCESVRTPVTAIINIPPSAPSTIAGSGCAAGSVLVKATGGSAGQFRWYTTATGGTAISGEVNGTYNTPFISTSTLFYVSIFNGTCESARSSVLAQISSPSAAPTVTNGISCGSGAVTLSAAGGNIGEYRWYSVATGGTAITGQTGATYVTPVLTTTTTYYVSINNGTCESTRTAVSATINTTPPAPTAAAVSGCASTPITITATGGSAGQFRWYTTSTGGTAISGQTNSTYAPTVRATTTFYVALNIGSCESARTAVTVTVTVCNQSPAIEPENVTASSGGTITIDLLPLIVDPDDNVDLSTLKVIAAPISGATTSISNNSILTLDYTGIAFTGNDRVTVQVCDTDGACAQREFSIDVIGQLKIYNGISPNGDGKNDAWIIESIELLEDTKVNHVTIFNRWGDSIFDTDNYDNTVHVFTGKTNSGTDAPAGTYFYKITYSSGRKTDNGYFTLKR